MSHVESAPAPEHPCRLLAIDTATEFASLALVLPDRILGIDAPGGAQTSTRLLDDVHQLLEQGGCGLGEVDAIAFGCGPGAFTGLRTACSVAQGLAFGADKPVLAVDSLMLVAESVRAEMLALGIDTVWVVQDARMEEIYAAQYRWQGHHPQRWQTLVAPALYSPAALNHQWDTGPATDKERVDAGSLAGSALPVLAARLNSGQTPHLGSADGNGRAQALARLAVSRFADGQLLHAAQALPLYLRDKVAQTTAERDALRAAKLS